MFAVDFRCGKFAKDCTFLRGFCCDDRKNPTFKIQTSGFLKKIAISRKLRSVLIILILRFKT